MSVCQVSKLSKPGQTISCHSIISRPLGIRVGTPTATQFIILIYKKCCPSFNSKEYIQPSHLHA